jgi:hypothetical protein
MGTRNIILFSFMMLMLETGIAQVNSRKEEREKDKAEKQHLIDSLMRCKEFVFEARMALPNGGGSVDLTGNSNYLKFMPEKIESYLPFFGRAYSIDYGGDGGIKFEGKPSEYTVATRKGGKGFEINATVPVIRDNYKLTLFVSDEGGASLTISSNQRSTISYHGDIMELLKDNGK